MDLANILPRYTDFLVNEITEDGNVVHLTDTSLPKPVQNPREVKPEPTAGPSEKVSETNGSAKKEQHDTELTVDDSDVKATETPAITEDTEMADGSDVKVEQSRDVATGTKTDQDHVQAEASKEDAQDDKTEASDPNAESKDHAQNSTESLVEKSLVSDEDNQLLTTYFGTKVCDSILALYKKVLQRPDGKASSYGIVTSEPINDRELRTKIHQVQRST